MTDTLVTDLISHAEGLRSQRSSFETTWQDIRNYIVPWMGSFTGDNSYGTVNRDRVVDNTGETVSELLAGALHGRLTNPGERWMTLRIGNGLEDDHEVVAWLEVAEMRMYSVFEDPDSLFYTEGLTGYHQLADLGTNSIYAVDRPGKVPLTQTIPTQQMLHEVNDEGVIDTSMRWWELTARNALRRWGDKVGEKVVKQASDPNTMSNPIEFLHVCDPRRNRDARRQDRSNLPVRSVTINVTNKELVDVGGFHEMPYITDRWTVRDGEAYGRGAGHKALADIKMLQRMSLAQIRGAEKTVNPPMMIPDGDAFDGPIDLRSGKTNVVRADLMMGRNDPIRAIIANARPDIGEELLAAVRARIEAAYYKPLILLDRDPRMTATQFVGIREEALTILAPFLGRIQNERLAKLVERVFAIMWRGNMFPPPPPQISGAPLRVEFVSPIVRARRLGEARAINEWYALMEPAIAVRPDTADLMDEDEAGKIVADRIGVPKIAMRDPRLLAQMRRARLEEQQTQAAVEQFATVAPAAQSAAQAAEAFGDRASDNNAQAA